MDYDKAYAIDLSCARPVVGQEDDPLVEGWMSYRMPEEKLRGGFRFATFKSISSSVVTVKVSSVKSHNDCSLIAHARPSHNACINLVVPF